MYMVLLIFQVVICTVLVGLILIQKGQGADIGAVFGGGGSQTVFGARGAGNFLSHTTAVIGAVFFLNSLGLAYLSDHSGSNALSGIALPSAVPMTTAAPVVAAPTQSVAKTASLAAAPLSSASAGKPLATP
ncbi:preprotein translocase subunit SecG [Acidithiobacillus ferriphilus]|uniref:preprotein translocase subunit SecG n=1 Tax=Acidithiobacillus ferriphilus TaxID=1689834 RepID=UPI00232B1E46|nr:preprotein translocase subunit SecG [Acidithiobacillus ferriphilus]WCE94585.1 preprotein translocase subunit SecG [Acidithiobacillus ferriphilus]